jgi:YesN/AraC family two-component response regulator
MIADYRLPDMTGLELVESARREGFNGEVIMITAFADQIEPDILARLRISHFFAKPLDLNALNRSIDYLLTKDEIVAGRPA